MVVDPKMETIFISPPLSLQPAATLRLSRILARFSFLNYVPTLAGQPAPPAYDMG